MEYRRNMSDTEFKEWKLFQKEKKLQKQRNRCLEKTSRGGAFNSQQEAHRVALRIEQVSTKRINEFLCPICGLWHVGSRGDKRA